MTNKERLISLLGFAPPANSAEGALLDASIDGAGVYNASLSSAIKKVAIQVMELLLTTADTNNGKVGFNINYDRTAIITRIKMIKGELGIYDESLPTIKGVSVW
jgi:hypothetical protein